MEPQAVERHDAGGFLTAVLKGMQAQGRDGGGIRMAVNSKDAAFFAEMVRIIVDQSFILARVAPQAGSPGPICRP
jgi:hypothetical protein